KQAENVAASSFGLHALTPDARIENSRTERERRIGRGEKRKQESNQRPRTGRELEREKRREPNRSTGGKERLQGRRQEGGRKEGGREATVVQRPCRSHDGDAVGRCISVSICWSTQLAPRGAGVDVLDRNAVPRGPT